MDQFNIWAMGINRLAQLNMTEQDRMNFMLPLLDMKPEYRDYSIFYTELVRLGTKYNKQNIANRADALIDEARLRDSIAEVQLEQEMQKQAKLQAARKKDSGKKRN